MDVPLAVALVALAGSLYAATMTYRSSRLATNVSEKANRDSALLKWAEQLQASETAARTEARSSRDRADRIKDEADAEVEAIRAQITDLKSELRKATQAATNLTDKLTMVQAEVWRPEPDIEALRRLVGRPHPGMNGRSI